MAIEDEIHRILLGPEVQKISFVAKGIRIDNYAYKAVAHKLKLKLITVEIDSSMDPDSGTYEGAKNAKGRGAKKDNTVTLRTDSVASLFDQGVIVHEMTHAVIDNMNLGTDKGKCLRWTPKTGQVVKRE